MDLSVQDVSIKPQWTQGALENKKYGWLVVRLWYKYSVNFSWMTLSSVATQFVVTLHNAVITTIKGIVSHDH